MVKMGFDGDALKRGLNEARSHIKGFNNRAALMGSKMIAAGGAATLLTGAIAGVATGAIAATMQLGNTADALLDLSAQSGLSTDTLQEFGAVARAAGVDNDVLGRSAIALTQRLKAGGDQSKEFTDAMAAIGVATHDAKGQLRSTDAMMPEIIASLSAMEDETTRNSLAMQIMGRGAVNLIPVLELGADQIDELTQSARENGEVMSGEQLDAANEARLAFQDLQKRFSDAARQVQIALLPVMIELADVIGEHVVPIVQSLAENVAGMITWFAELDPVVQGVVGGMVALAAAAGPVLIFMGSMITAVGKISLALKALAPIARAAWTAMGGPVAWIVAGIVALGVAAYVFRDDIRKAFYEVASIVSGVISSILENLSDAIEYLQKFAAAASMLPGPVGSAARLANTALGTMSTTLDGMAGRADEWSTKFADTANSIDDVTEAAEALKEITWDLPNQGLDANRVEDPADKTTKGGGKTAEGLAGGQTAPTVTEPVEPPPVMPAPLDLAADLEQLDKDIRLGLRRIFTRIEPLRIDVEYEDVEHEQLIPDEALSSIDQAREKIRQLTENYTAATSQEQRMVIKADIEGTEETLAEMQGFTAESARLMEANRALNEAMVAGMNDMVGGIGESLGMLMAGTATASSIANAILGPLADMAIKVGKIAIAVGIGIEGIRKALSSLNPVVAIAAGIALVALGTWAKSALGGAASGGAGGAAAGATAGAGAGGFNTPDTGYGARRSQYQGVNAHRQSLNVNVDIQGDSSLRGTTLRTQYAKTQTSIIRRGMG